jgi:hypothetical protein
VVVAAAAHSPARHAAALRKLGVSQQQQQQGVAFVVADSDDGATEPAAAAAARPGGDCAPLQRLVERLKASAEALLAEQPPAPRPTPEPAGPAGAPRAPGLTLVLDSLPALLSLFPGRAGAGAFLQSCRSLGAALGVARFRFAALAAADDPGEAAQVAALRHTADAVLALHAVEGRTADLDGRLDVALRRAPASGRALPIGPDALPASWLDGAADFSAPGVRSWHFRVGDVAVRWLPERIDGKQVMV